MACHMYIVLYTHSCSTLIISFLIKQLKYYICSLFVHCGSEVVMAVFVLIARTQNKDHSYKVLEYLHEWQEE